MKNKKNIEGFSLIELLLAMTIVLLLMGIASSLFATAIGTRARESQKTDALTAAQAALNIISRELANSGYGLTNNGIIIADSNANRIHFRSNVVNNDSATNSPGEDITYFYDAGTQSIVRYIPRNANGSPETSVIVNNISKVTFQYFDYTGASSTPVIGSVPTKNTGRVTINVNITLSEVQGQVKNQFVTFTSDITLRNSKYMLNQY